MTDSEPTTLRILLAQECEKDYLLLRHLLAQINDARFELHWVATAALAHQALEQGHYDVCLVNDHLGGQSGLEFLRSEVARNCTVPIIMLTDQGDRQQDLAAMQVGASDFLVKGQITADMLERAIRYAMTHKHVEQNLQHSNQQLTLLIRASAALGSTLDLDEVLMRVLGKLQQCLRAAGTFWLIDAATGELVCHQASGPVADTLRHYRLHSGQGIAGWVALHGEPLVVADSALDARHFAALDILTGITYRSILCVPLRAKQKVIGALEVLDRPAGRFLPEDLAFVESLATSAALAIENARLYQQVRYELGQREQALAQLQLANDKLATNQTRLRTIIEADASGLLVLNLNGVIEFANPAAQALLARSSEELVGSPLGFALRVDTTTEVRLELPDGRHTHAEMHLVNIDWAGAPCLLATLHDITERKQIEETLRSLSLHDSLTELNNQRGFVLLGEQMLAMARRQSKSTLLFFADIDGMKDINDRLGHAQGDQALLLTAEVLRASFRGSDILARIGGDEFAVLALQSGGIGIQEMTDQLQDNLAKANQTNNYPFSLKLSVGAVLCQPDDSRTLKELMVRADESMYKQKRGKHGRAAREKAAQETETGTPPSCAA